MIVQPCKNHRRGVKLRSKEASMNFMTYQEPEREKQRIQSIREERNTRKTKEEGKPKSRPRSIATVHRELSFMRRILNVAVANGWIMRNPLGNR
jgi:hypothetical protein